MPTPTYTALANVTLGTAVSSVTFSSIPATYRDLIAVYNGTAATGGDLYMTLNADSSNYSMVRIVGSTTVTSVAESTREIGLARTGETSLIVQIMDYSATDKHKTTLSRSNGPIATSVVAAYASRYASTSAITSVGFTINGGHNFQTGSTLALYAIAS
jgi:hypothetical protein